MTIIYYRSWIKIPIINGFVASRGKLSSKSLKPF